MTKCSTRTAAAADDDDGTGAPAFTASVTGTSPPAASGGPSQSGTPHRDCHRDSEGLGAKVTVPSTLASKPGLARLCARHGVGHAPVAATGPLSSSSFRFRQATSTKTRRHCPGK
jgi:hypothetical protein